MDFNGGSSSTDGLRELSEEHPANLSVFSSSLDRPSRPSASLAASMATVSRYYTLANITPSSPLSHLGDEYPPPPHNRILSTQSIRQTRNNFQHFTRAPQLQSDHNSDIEDRLGAQGLVELSRASSSSPNEATSIIGASYEIFPGQSFRATRGGEKGLKNQSMMEHSFLKLEQEEGNIVHHSQVLECHSSHDVNLDDLPYNWQAGKSTVKERISNMFNKNAMADVYFIVGRSPNIRHIPGHQFVLAISSAVFDAMFFGPLSAKKVKKGPSIVSNDYSVDVKGDNNQLLELKLEEMTSMLEISVPDVEPTAFLALLKFIYTDEVHIGPDTVMTTLYAAKKYSIPALEKSCVEYLRRNLCSDNAFMLLTQARLFNEVQLAHQCLDVIDKNTSEALSADGFLDIDLDTLCTVLDRDTLGIREVKLFQATVKWAQSQLRKRDDASQSMMAVTEEPTMLYNNTISNELEQKSQLVFPTNLPDVSCAQLRTILGPALQLIRFPLMSIDDFAATVAQSKILTDREMVDMFLYYLTNPKPFIPYKDTPRCCLTGKEQVVNRYPVVEQRWGYSGTSDRIRFMVDRKIFVVGFGLYGSAQGPAEYQVIVEILQQDSGGVLASNYLTFKCDGSNSTFRVRFKEPVEILPNVSYIACATLKGPDSYYGSIGYQKVIHESATHGKVSFQFNYAAGNNNGTSVEDGQIPEIIFYM